MSLALKILLAFALHDAAQAGANIDGGRGDLPGMRQDMFDQAQKMKQQGGHIPRGKVPDCPKSDKMSPFFGLAFASGGLYVKVDSAEGKCQKLVTVNGANFTELQNFSRTCGPAGEWKARIAEELSAMFFQGGLEWVKSENETVEVVTEEGTFQLEVSEAKYAILEECWKRGCDCEQAKDPVMRVILLTLLAVGVGGVFMDSGKYAWEKFRGKKPPKHVCCKKGHRMEEVKIAHSHRCDSCGCSGTSYKCNGGCNYDLCKKCYKEQRKKVKAAWAEWCEKHPEDKKKSKDKDEDEDDDDKKKLTSGDEKESGAEPDSGTEGKSAANDSEEDKASAATSGEKADSDAKSE